MRVVAAAAIALSFASAVFAQLTPGTVVHKGEPFPIVADFNGDGLDDLVQDRSVILSTAAGPTDVRDLGFGMLEEVVGVPDVNGDRIPDLLTRVTGVTLPPSLDPQGESGREPALYRLYIADAARRYSKKITVSTGFRPYVADADGDGKDDLFLFTDIRAGVRSIASEVTVLRSLGDGTFERLKPFRIPVLPQIQSDPHLLSADLNHDGLPDIVIRCAYDLVMLYGTGGGNFAVESRYMPLNSEFGAWSTRIADVDGDSNIDVVLVCFRGIRVLFGDGRGNFPRMSRTQIAKLHDAVLPSDFPPMNVDAFNQPRDLAVGNFTRRDQMQIAAGTGEGDLVVYAWEQGALREVARTATEFWLPTVRSGRFHNGTGSDLYVMGTLIWGDVWPRPRVFEGNAASRTAEAPIRLAGRGRVSRTLTPELTLESQIRGECLDATEQWAFVRNGVFATARHDGTVVEALPDGARLYIRIAAPFSTELIEAELEAGPDGTYSGTAGAMTSCGWKTVTITAKPRA